jgi:PAS domain-containing protein
MKAFICEQNVAHFTRLLSGATDPNLRRTLQSLLSSAKRELAISHATIAGADTLPNGRKQSLEGVRRQIQAEFDLSPHPYMLLDPGPGLQIVDVNDAYASATLTRRADVVGKSLFEIFPDNPEDEFADGVSNLYASLRTVAQTGQPHAMAVQRYDIRDTSGQFVERHWQPINTPIHDAEGHLIFLLHHVEDVTEEVVSSSSEKLSKSD